MSRKFLDINTASVVIKDLVSNVEKTEYDITYVPVDIIVSHSLETYNILLLYKKDNLEDVLNEIDEKFKNNDVNGFLKPSKNYIQLSFFRNEDIPIYNYNITFKRENAPLSKNEIVSTIVDPNYMYIDNIMNKWFDLEEKSNNKKYDDIYKYIDIVSKKQSKKNVLTKRMFNKISFN